jgi:hypothetical protein
MSWNGLGLCLASQFGCHSVKSPEIKGFGYCAQLLWLILQSAENEMVQFALRASRRPR